MKINPVVHFKMPYEDRDRMAVFYAKVFGWQAQMLDPELGKDKSGKVMQAMLQMKKIDIAGLRQAYEQK